MDGSVHVFIQSDNGLQKEHVPECVCPGSNGPVTPAR